jgi:hypothetical protein
MRQGQGGRGCRMQGRAGLGKRVRDMAVAVAVAVAEWHGMAQSKVGGASIQRTHPFLESPFPLPRQYIPSARRQH